MKIKGFKKAYEDGLLTRRLLRQLERFGLIVEFYYVYVGNNNDHQGSERPRRPELDEYESAFLTEKDMREVASCEDWLSEAMLLDRLQRGLKCFAVKHRGQIVSYLWCAFEEINDRCYQVKLKQDEVHLYNAYTRPACRGKGLAPFMRYQCYDELNKMGIEKFYSHCNVFNTPSVRYKEKTHTPIQKMGLFLALGNKYSWNWILKKYDIP